jgi:hypothetical protein
MSFNAFVVDAAAKTVTESSSAACTIKGKQKDSNRAIAVMQNADARELFLIIAIFLFNQLRRNVKFSRTLPPVR